MSWKSSFLCFFFFNFRKKKKKMMMYLNGHGLKWICEIILRSNLWMTSALSKSLEITNMHVQGVSWNLSSNGGIFTCLAALSTFPPQPKPDVVRSSGLKFGRCAHTHTCKRAQCSRDWRSRASRQTPAYALAVGTIEWPQLDLRATFLDDPWSWHAQWRSIRFPWSAFVFSEAKWEVSKCLPTVCC